MCCDRRGVQLWFQIAWPEKWKGVNIAIKEMIPVVASAALWGSTWESAQVHLNIDNQVVVAALNRGRARDPHLAHLLRCLFFYEAHFKFERRADHVPGKHNIAADALSRNQVKTFHFVCPQAQSTPTQVPQQLVALLMDPSLNWRSRRWKQMFRDTLSRVLLSQP